MAGSRAMILPKASTARRCSPSSPQANPLRKRDSVSPGFASIFSVRRSVIRRKPSRPRLSIIRRNSRSSPDGSSGSIPSGSSAMTFLSCLLTYRCRAGSPFRDRRERCPYDGAVVPLMQPRCVGSVPFLAVAFWWKGGMAALLHFSPSRPFPSPARRPAQSLNRWPRPKESATTRSAV